jgi:UDP-N-acetylmuramyl pentapeptide synthase
LIAELTSVAPATVLVKGSRSAATETIVAALCGAGAQGAH